MDANREMSHGRRSLTVVTDRRSIGRLRGPCSAIVLGLLALALAGCGSGSAPLSQPLDVGKSVKSGPDQHLAEKGDHDRTMPHVIPNAQGGSDLLTNGARPATAGAANPAPQRIAPPETSNEDPTQPTAAEPLLDAGGFDPTPQDGGEADHSTASGDMATVPGSHG